jgi:FkbM family methyltransferase
VQTPVTPPRHTFQADNANINRLAAVLPERLYCLAMRTNALLDWLPLIGTARLRRRGRALAARLTKRSNQDALVAQLMRLKATGTTDWVPSPPEKVHVETPLVGFEALKVDIEGVIYYVPDAAQDTLFDRLIHRRQWPRDTLGYLLPFAHGEIMLDIGANVGTTLLPRAVLGVFRHIHAFEPEPKNFACLTRAIEENNMSSVVTAWPCAIGAEEGETTLIVSDGIGRHRLGEGSEARSITVKIRTLDGWLDETGTDPAEISFVKVDTQGYEPFVLAGATKLLETRKAVWQLEVSPKHIKAATSDIDDFCRTVERYFTHFVDLRAIDRGLRPASELKHAVRELPSKFTDILAMNVR